MERTLMSDDDKKQLQHPEGKKMSRIDAAQYDMAHTKMQLILSEVDEIKPKELFARMTEQLKGRFEGNVGRYTEGAKLDMEAQGAIVRDRQRGFVAKVRSNV